MGFHEEELAGLSDEERLALDGADEDGAEEGAAGDAAEDVPAAAPEESTQGSTDVASSDTQESATESEPEEDYEEPFVVRYQADPVEDYEAKLAELDNQFESGDLTLKEYNSQREALLKQQLKAEIAAEQRQQADQQKWHWEIERFMEDNPIYTQDKILYAALDAAVKDLANRPENSERTGRWFLAEAHKLVQKRFSVPAQPATQPQSQPTPAKSVATRDVPRTLSTLPAADMNETSADEFAYIDALINKGKVIEAERALARLTPEQQARYLEVSS